MIECGTREPLGDFDFFNAGNQELLVAKLNKLIGTKVMLNSS